MHRRFLNLITHDWDRRMYSLHRLDLMKHLFYPSSTAAREAAAARDAKTKNKNNSPSIIERLPDPEFSFHPTAGTLHIPRMDSFSLLGRHGVVFADSSGKAAALYDTARGVFTAIPPANTRKEHPLGMSFQAAETEDDPSLYVLDLSCGAEIDTCFEVLARARHDGAWRWRTLPGPPFLSGGGPPYSRRPTIQNCSYAAIDGSIICISSMEQGVGTYAFDTASRAWRQVGQWALPFRGRAEYVPELKLWLGLLSDYCNPFPRLCAFDLSVTAMDAAEHPPTPQHAWDYLDLCSQYSEGGDDKKTLIYGLHLVNLGSGKFCIATHIRIMWSPPCAPVDEDMAADNDSSSCNYSEPEIPMTDIIPVEDFIVFTGVEVGRCCSCDGPRMIKHKSKRYDPKLPMKAVL